MKHIKNAHDYHTAMAEIETYLAKGFDQLTESEETRLKQLSDSVSAYEQIHFPMPVVHDLSTILTAYMKENNLTRQRLAAYLEVGNSTLSEILNKKRPITLDFAKKLHSKLKIDGNLILELA
jgi:HTH-type transcriptional regulator/antitoxin HigA